MLDLERQTWKHAGSKTQAILELFGCHETQYYSELGVLIDRPEALAAAPQVVNRLRRLRDTRMRRRGALRLSPTG